MCVSLFKNDYKFTFEIIDGKQNVTIYQKGKFYAAWTVDGLSSHVPMVIEHIIRDISPAFPTEWLKVCVGYLDEVANSVY